MAHKRRFYPGNRGTLLALGCACPACGKHCYRTRSDAKRAIAQIRSRGVHVTRAYRCGDFWHLTSQDTAATTHHREESAS